MDARSAYREGTARGASGVRLVIFLYEQAIQDLRQALHAMKEGNVEVRTRHLNHALSVIGHLQGTLDRERGGKVGRDLDRFYNTVRSCLMEAQARVSQEVLNEQIACLLSVREAWIEVENTTPKSPSAPPLEAEQTDDTFTATKTGSSGWSG
jgi:flagellar secretion chaperone FliS